MTAKQCLIVNAAPAAGAGNSSAPSADQTATQTSFVTNLGLTLYLLFVVSWFLHLGRRYPVLGSIRFDLVLGAAISVLCLLSPRNRPEESTRWTSRRFVFVLVGYAFLTIPFVEWPGTVLKTGFPEFCKAAVFCLFTSTLVRNQRGLRYLVAVFVGCQAFRVLEPLYLHVTEGYWGSVASMANWEYLDRLAGAPGDIVNPNGLAFVIVTTLAFAHFLSPLSNITLWAYLAFVPVGLWALALTASRTGMLALAIVVAAIWWKSRRKVLLALCVAAAILVARPLFSDDLMDRYASMFSAETKNRASATDRSKAAKAGLVVAMRRPLFGHGLGTSAEANSNFGINEQPAHNLYVEIAQELGFLGIPLFVCFMATLALELRRVRLRCRETGATGLIPRLADSLQVFLLMNVTFSLASYGLSGYEWYFMAGLCGALTRLSANLPAVRPSPVVSAPTKLVVSRQRPLRATPGPAVERPHAVRRTAPCGPRHGIR